MMVPSSKYPCISVSLLDAPLVLSKASCGIGRHHQTVRRTYTLCLHARSKVGFVSPINQIERKNSGNLEDRGDILLRNTETKSQLHMTPVNNDSNVWR